ncbi:unnamed protein product [Heterobilharzia americana]|nr:unnamed protein product [Heterobilharzia americana]
MAGLALNVEQPTSMSKRLYLDWLNEKRTHLSLHGPNKRIARRTDHKWEDRLVLDGFSKFIDFLASGINVHNRCIVRHVFWPSFSDRNKVSKLTDIQSICEGAASWSSKTLMDFVESSNLICVEAMEYTDELSGVTSNQQSRRYFSRFCIVTVPVGVLKGLDRRSAIRFHPCLPPRKRLAINRLGIPKLGAETHNKVILVFNKSEVFWDRNTAHITCPGAYLHILNCDFYGNPGVLVAHVWGGSKLKITGQTDQAIIKNLMDLLGGMYPSQCPLPEPIFTYVTRWSEDAFSLGAYTAGEVESDDTDRQAYASSLPSKDCPKLLFAGEGTVDSSGGQQCTHGAFSSGVDRALDVLDCIQGGRCRLRDVRIIDYLTGHRCDRFPPHEMVRRAGKRKLSNPIGVCKTSAISPDFNSSFKEESLNKSVQSSHELPSTESSDSQFSEGDSSSSTLDFESSDSDTLFPKPTRRSTRMTTWISSQASSSLRREFLLMFQKKKHVNRCVTNDSTRLSSVDSSNDHISSEVVNEKPLFPCYTRDKRFNLPVASVAGALSLDINSSSVTQTCISNMCTSSPCMLTSFHGNSNQSTVPANSLSPILGNSTDDDLKGISFSNSFLNKSKTDTIHSDSSVSDHINEGTIDHIKPTNFEPVFGALPFSRTCDNTLGLRAKSFSFEEALKVRGLPVSP